MLKDAILTSAIEGDPKPRGGDWQGRHKQTCATIKRNRVDPAAGESAAIDNSDAS